MYEITALVCDDDLRFIADFTDLVKQICDSEGFNIKVLTASSAQELIKYLDEKAEINVFYLDVEMPGLSGIDLGHLIRNKYGLHEALVVYITNFAKYQGQMFPIHVYDCFLKPVSYSVLNPHIHSVYGSLMPIQTISFYHNKSLCVLSMKGIVSVESDRRTNIVLYDNSDRYEKYQYYGSLKDVESTLLGSVSFGQPHYALILNFRYMKYVTGEEVLMEDGRRITISRGKKDAFVKALFLFDMTQR